MIHWIIKRSKRGRLWHRNAGCQVQEWTKVANSLSKVAIAFVVESRVSRNGEPSVALQGWRQAAARRQTSPAHWTILLLRLQFIEAKSEEVLSRIVLYRCVNCRLNIQQVRIPQWRSICRVSRFRELVQLFFK